MAGAEVEEAYESLAGWAAQKGQREIITAILVAAEHVHMATLVNSQQSDYEKLKVFDAQILQRMRLADRIIAIAKLHPPQP